MTYSSLIYKMILTQPYFDIIENKILYQRMYSLIRAEEMFPNIKRENPAD